MMLVFFIGFASTSYAASAKEIDADADAALERFYKQVEGAKEFMKEAKGVLIMPSVKKGAFIVGGEYGQGALRIGGKTVDYYSIISGSVGFQIGGEAKDMIIGFMHADALKKFRDSKGWEAGADGNVALIKKGGGSRAAVADEAVVAYVFDVKGLMGDLSLRGAKFNKLDK
jgi:lipid-binding SYLF domain-containing protein